MAQKPWEKYANASTQSQEGEAPAGPWVKYQAPKKEEPQTSAKQAALEHFGNAASLGYLPQLQGLASQLMPDPNREVNRKLRDQGFEIQEQKPTYLYERDAAIKRLEQEAKEHPYAAGVGSVGGALTSGIAASALTPINAASRLGRVLQAGKGGALLGAIANPGDKEGEVADGVQLDDRARNALTGAALGSAGQGAIEGASKAAKAFLSLPETLKAKAEERAFKSAGAMLKDYRVANKQDRIHALGRYMLDNGLVKPGMTVDDIAEATKALESKHGEAIGSILKKFDEAGASGPSAQELATAIEKQAEPLKNLSTARATYRTLKNVASDVKSIGKEPPIVVSQGEVGSLTGKGTEYLTDPVTGEVMAQFQNGNLVSAGSSGSRPGASALSETLITPTQVSTDLPGTFQGAQEIKKFIEDQIQASGGFKALNPTEKNLALRQAYTMVKEKLEERAGKAAEQLGDPELLKSYLGNKSGYRNSKEIAQIAKDQALRQNANRFFSPSDYLTAGTGALAGAASGDSIESKLKNAALGASLGLVNRGVRRYGTPMVSVGMDRAGSFLARTPLPVVGELASPVLSSIEKSPGAMANTARILSSPQFERAIESAPLRKIAEDEKPLRGEDRWARSGLEKLGIQDAEVAAKLLQSKRGKQLLIEASDLSPGSKAMQRIKDQIQKGWVQDDTRTSHSPEILRREREPARRR